MGDPPNSPDDSAARALTELYEMAIEVDLISGRIRSRLQDVLNRCEGLELAGKDELRTFKAAFDKVSWCAFAAPCLKDGTRGSLQVRINNAGKAYTAIASGGRYEYTKAPPNTIPELTITCRV